MNKPHLYFFGRDEFDRQDKYGLPINWFDHMSPRLLVLLDVFRFRIGEVVNLSKDPKGIGRQLGPASISDHNVDRWGEVRAVDCWSESMRTPGGLHSAYLLAVDCGFTSLGVYPYWNNPGLHLGVRQDRVPGKPAAWGRVPDADGNIIQVSVNDALEWMA